MAQTIAHLGRFKLGEATLGASEGNTLMFDTISISDSNINEIGINIADTITIAELLVFIMELAETDTITLTDGGSFPVYAWAGVDGRIVQLLNITSDDFCAIVEESGQNILVNDETKRAFFQIQQRTRRFDREIETEPSDAIMYACPELAITDATTGELRWIQIGDVIEFEFTTYTIVAIINHYIDGNVIARQCACKLDAIAPAAPTGVR